MNPNIQKILTIVFLLSSAAFIWQILDIYPQIAITEADIKTQEDQVKDMEDSKIKLKEFADYVSENREIVEKFNTILPVEDDKANLLSSLDNLANVSGLGTIKISFDDNAKPANSQPAEASAESKNDFDAKTVQMTLRGNYAAFKNFLAAVEKNMRIADIISVDLGGDSQVKTEEEDNKVYSYSIALKTYFHKDIKEKNIIKALRSEKLKNFSVKKLNFAKEKIFSDLLLPSEYNINAGVDEIGKQNIF